MSEEDYPYKGDEGACAHDKSKVVARAGDWTVLSGEVEVLKQAIQQGPFTIYVQAGHDWTTYLGGILTYKEYSAQRLNHGVNVVGLGYELTTVEEVVKAKYKLKCKMSYSGFCIKNKKRRR